MPQFINYCFLHCERSCISLALNYSEIDICRSYMPQKLLNCWPLSCIMFICWNSRYLRNVLIVHLACNICFCARYQVCAIMTQTLHSFCCACICGIIWQVLVYQLCIVVRFEVLTSVAMKIPTFQVVTPCNLDNRNEHFGITYSFHHYCRPG
jgi:hypothetical protein